VAERGGWVDQQRTRVDELVDRYRVALHDSLNDLTEQEARRRLVPSNAAVALETPHRPPGRR
jgi:hypothetical protein